MQIIPYLAFDGKCKEAFTFYEKVLGGKILMMMTTGESPMADQTPPEARDRIMHARLVAGDAVLMGGDAPSDFKKPHGFCVSIQLTDVAEGERIFKALGENGTVQMPFGATFWAAGFGMLIDQFDIPWMVNCETPA